MKRAEGQPAVGAASVGITVTGVRTGPGVSPDPYDAFAVVYVQSGRTREATFHTETALKRWFARHAIDPATVTQVT